MKSSEPSSPLVPAAQADAPVAALTPTTDDARLLAALRAGDNAAYETLVRENGPRMLAVAKRLLRDQTAAEEAVQDAFISAFNAIESFHGESKLSTWLHRITVNAALMKLRKAGRLRETSIDGMLPAFAENGHPASRARAWPSIDEEREQTRRIVMDAIDQLPEIYRAVLIMRDVDGLSTAQASQLLEISEPAVKVRLHRARLALRELLDKPMREGNL